MSLLAGDRISILAHATCESAYQHLRFDRDESDSYRIQLETGAASGRALTRAQVMPALPVGSRWTDAVGWESYVVFPSNELESPDVAIVGIEYVVPHATRNAYPVFAGALVAMDAVPGILRSIAKRLVPEGAESPSSPVEATYGVVTSKSRSPAEHLPCAAWLLQAAATSFEADDPLLVRTLVLTEDEVPKARHLLSRSLLLGTAPPIRSRFSASARAVLSLKATT